MALLSVKLGKPLEPHQYLAALSVSYLPSLCVRMSLFVCFQSATASLIWCHCTAAVNTDWSFSVYPLHVTRDFIDYFPLGHFDLFSRKEHVFGDSSLRCHFIVLSPVCSFSISSSFFHPSFLFSFILFFVFFSSSPHLDRRGLLSYSGWERSLTECAWCLEHGWVGAAVT